MNFTNKDKQLILNKFEIESNGAEPSEEELFQLLCDQIAYMIEYRMEFLLSLLYRNDVEESKINWALSPACADPANIALAKLVMNRQKARVATKKSIAVKPIEDLEDELRWE